MSLYNKTTWLLMPMAFYNKSIKGFDILATNGFISAYIADADIPDLDDKLILEYEDRDEFYDIPDKFKEDYWKIICSQYHEVHPLYLDYVLDFWGGKFKPPLGPYDEFEIFEEVKNMGVLL